MIISASRRTDIPAFFSSWFMERIREGTVQVKNPFNPSQIKTVSLLPTNVEVIVFWTRNAEPILPHLRELDDRGFNYVFLYSITGYGPPLEKNNPPLEKTIAAFKELSRKIGAEKVIWRFDPLIYVSGKGEDWITSRFAKIASSIGPDTRRVIISFLDFYAKVVQRLKKLEQTAGLKVIDISQQKDLIKKIALTLSQTAGQNNLEIFSCAEKNDLTNCGINPGSCIDGELFNRIFGLNIKSEKDKHQRPQCRCTISQDIGRYGTCGHGCVYCYAS